MALTAIVRKLPATILRTPLLWFFSVISILSSDPFSLGQGASTWLNCLALLLFPVSILAGAGQIRSVQMQYEGAAATIPQIIDHCGRKMKQLVVILIATIVLGLVVAAPFWIIARLARPGVPCCRGRPPGRLTARRCVLKVILCLVVVLLMMK